MSNIYGHKAWAEKILEQITNREDMPMISEKFALEALREAKLPIPEKYTRLGRKEAA